MQGKRVVWVPGLDHAGIATQMVVEKKLFSASGQTRHDIGRKKFVEEIWEWKQLHGNTINRQLRRLGASLDWKR